MARPTSRTTMLTLIKNATVFAPEPLGIRQVLVAANRIVYVGQAVPELDARLNVDEVDADGARLIPGFIDPHAHVTGGGGEAGFETSVPAPVLTDYTRAGVTTVVGLLRTDDLVRTTSAMIARIKALRSEGLSAWGYTGGYSDAARQRRAQGKPTGHRRSHQPTPLMMPCSVSFTWFFCSQHPAV